MENTVGKEDMVVTSISPFSTMFPTVSRITPPFELLSVCGLQIL